MSKYSQHESAIIERGFEAGGFPISKTRLIKLFDQNTTDDFDALRERMRSAIMKIEGENLTMEQVSSVAHICAVIAYKLKDSRS